MCPYICVCVYDEHHRSNKLFGVIRGRKPHNDVLLELKRNANIDRYRVLIRFNSKIDRLHEAVGCRQTFNPVILLTLNFYIIYICSHATYLCHLAYIARDMHLFVVLKFSCKNLPCTIWSVHSARAV